MRNWVTFLLPICMHIESISTYFHSICLPIQDLLNGSAGWVPFWKHGYYNISTKSLAGINLKVLMKISQMFDSKFSLYCIAYIFKWRIAILNYPKTYSDIVISMLWFSLHTLSTIFWAISAGIVWWQFVFSSFNQE